MFVRTKQPGCVVNTRHIVKVEALKNSAFATLATGDGVTLEGYYYDLVPMLEYETTVAALPGWEALFFHCAEDAPALNGWVQREPVVAWRISGSHALAVTVDPDNVPLTLLRPNGTVTNPYDQDWDDLDAWLEHVRKTHDAERKPKAAE